MNSNSKVLALKYRPQTFDQLVGQKVIAESIFNSIKHNKIPNAYMFLGIRGSGLVLDTLVSHSSSVWNLELFSTFDLLPIVSEE